jgi:hypothetical protein
LRKKLEKPGDTQIKHCQKKSGNPSEYYLSFGRKPKITMEVSNCVTHLDNVVAGELSDESGTLPVLGMAQAQLTSLIP